MGEGWTTTALCCCAFSNAYLVISVFPYAGFLALHLVPTATTENAGVYAGAISSSFFLARFFTAYWWGHAADTYGRKRTLQIALVLSALASIGFGLADRLWLAILFRSLLGMSNGIVSITKTLASEVVETESSKRRVMGLVVGMRSWGFLIAPALAGWLSEPEFSTFHVVWTRYPFLLPNLMATAICLTTALMVQFFVPETLSATGAAAKHHEQSTPTERTVLLDPPTSTNEKSFWQSAVTRDLMISHWTYSIVTTYCDEAFPLFCMSQIGGLSLRETDIGTILSGAGLFFAVFQYWAFSNLSARLGVYRTLVLGCLLGCFPAFLVPASIWMKTRARTFYLMLLMGFLKLMHSVYYTTLALAMNKTVSSSHRGRMNSTVLTGNSITRGIGPSFAGLMATLSFSGHLEVAPQLGAWTLWGISPLLGLVVLFRVQTLGSHEIDSR